MRTLLRLASFPALAAVGLLLGACQSNELLIRDEAAGFNGGFEVAQNGTPVNPGRGGSGHVCLHYRGSMYRLVR